MRTAVRYFVIFYGSAFPMDLRVVLFGASTGRGTGRHPGSGVAPIRAGMTEN